MSRPGGPVARLLSSPRRRRRLAFGSVLLVLAGLVAFVGLEYSNTAQKIHERITSEPPQLVPPPLKAARLSAIDKDAARAVAELFITTAVLRQRVGASWDVLAPSMQKGFTRASWSAGDGANRSVL